MMTGKGGRRQASEKQPTVRSAAFAIESIQLARPRFDREKPIGGELEINHSLASVGFGFEAGNESELQAFLHLESRIVLKDAPDQFSLVLGYAVKIALNGSSPTPETPLDQVQEFVRTTIMQLPNFIQLSYQYHVLELLRAADITAGPKILLEFERSMGALAKVVKLDSLDSQTPSE